MNDQFTFEYPSADAVMDALMAGEKTAPRTPGATETPRRTRATDRFFAPDEIVISVEETRYEPSSVEALVNAAVIGALVVTCGIVLAMEGVQAVFA
jgi:hypothetical protein